MLTIEQIARILKAHGVPYYIAGERILADSMEAFTDIFQNVVDVTGYTRRELLAWLGY